MYNKMSQYTNIRIKKSCADDLQKIIIPYYKNSHSINENTKISIPFIIEQIIEYIINQEKLNRGKKWTLI